MADKSPTPILLDTAILSRMVSDILETAGAPSSKKSACLNKIAGRLAGAKHNWGYLTGSDAPIIAESLSGLEVVAVGAKPDPFEDRSEVSIAAYPAAVRAGLICGFNAMLISGPIGVGLETSIIKAAEEAGRKPFSIRLAMLYPDEFLDHSKTRLQEHIQPRTGKNDITIYSDVDRLDADTLAALEGEISRLQEIEPTAQVMLLTHNPKILLPRLEAHAAALLDCARIIRVKAPEASDLIMAPTLSWPRASEWLEASKAAADAPQFLPNWASYKKAGQIMQAAQDKIEALNEAERILSLGSKPASGAEPDHAELMTSLNELIAFIGRQEQISLKVISYMQENAEAVLRDIQTNDVTPKAWEDVARIAHFYEEAQKKASDSIEHRHANVLRVFAEAKLGAHAPDLLLTFGIEVSGAQ